MSNQPDIETVKFNLLENAKHSIQLGIEDYMMAKYDRKRNISSIRNIFAGLLLLYKYKLLLESPSDKPYIYISSIQPKNYIDIYNGNFGKEKPSNTVDVNNIKINLKTLEVNIDENLLISINKTRNNIEHFYNTQNVDILKMLIDSFRLIESFYEDYLKHFLSVDLKDFLGKKAYQTILENKDIYEKKLNECHQSFDDIEFPNEFLKEIFIEEIRCPYCLSNLIKCKSTNYNDLELQCAYCSEGDNLDKYNVLGLTHHLVKDGGDFRENCPECEEYTIILNNFCLECGFEKDPNIDYDRECHLNYLREKDD